MKVVSPPLSLAFGCPDSNHALDPHISRESLCKKDTSTDEMATVRRYVKVFLDNILSITAEKDSVVRKRAWVRIPLSS
jgi:hypothetical protein